MFDAFVLWIHPVLGEVRGAGARPGAAQGDGAARKPRSAPRPDTSPELSAPWAEEFVAKPSKTAVGLESFASYYPESKRLPKLPSGQPTVDTFDEPQLRALHAAYWSAPPSATLGELIALAKKSPAFKSRKDAVDERQVGRLFAKLPGSSPWGWRDGERRGGRRRARQGAALPDEREARRRRSAARRDIV